MQALKARYRVIDVSDRPGLHFFFDGTGKDAVNLGSVEFKGGKVDNVSRVWGNYQGRTDPVEMAKTLMAALESASEASGSTSQVSVEIQRVPGMEFRTTWFRFANGRRVSFGSVEGEASKGGRQVSISESLGIK